MVIDEVLILNTNNQTYKLYETYNLCLIGIC